MSAPLDLRLAALAEGLTKRYRGRVVLDGVDLELGSGVTGLLGPNGAGKTTLLRILATVLTPDAGELRLFGRDPSRVDDRHEVRRHLGYQPQEPGFFQGFTVRAFLDYVAILKEIVDGDLRRGEVRRVLGLVGLEDRADDKIRRLSGGMRRRVAVAQALLGDPRLVLFDEPTAGLDPEERLRFRAVASDVGSRHAVVLSTHNTDDVAALCDRVVVLLEGRVAFGGSPAELTARAEGRVWTADQSTADALVTWRDGTGRHRQLGTPPPGAELVPPTLEDGYLLLLHRARSAS